MKKNIRLFLCTLFVLVFALASCNPGTQGGEGTGSSSSSTSAVTESCEHTYADSWTSDKEGHWYAATCGCADEKANYADHSDKDNDGVCDVCEYAGDHEHTYASEWSTDETNHWHAAACGHAVKDAEGAHADANNDGACDTCGYTGGHTHTYATEWSHDATHHWLAVTCGHAVDVKDKAEHADADNDGVCDGCAWNYDHEHTFAEEWSHDADNHWHAATCDHAVKDAEGAHADINNDGICDGCAWNYDHEHTYNTEKWAMDETNHWHAASCGHKVDGIDVAAHSDENNDEVCDVCAYDYNHVHEYSDAWEHDLLTHWHPATCGCSVYGDLGDHTDKDYDSVCDVCAWDYDHLHEYSEDYEHDETHHWHPSSCGHTVVSGMNPHTDANNNKECDYCGYDYGHRHTYDKGKWVVGVYTHYYAPTCGCSAVYVRDHEEDHYDENGDGWCDACGGVASFEAIVDMATSEEAANSINGGTITSTASSGYTTEVEYKFGNKYTYIDEKSFASWGDDAYERNLMMLDNGTVFAMVNGWREYAEADAMKGYYFDGNFVWYAYQAYGVEDLVYGLYELTDSELVIGEPVWYFDEATEEYTVIFNYLDGSLYVVSMTVKMGGDNNALETVEIKSTVYRDADVDYSYDLDKNEIKVLEGAEADEVYTISIAQTIGARVAEAPYDTADFVNSYVIKDANGKEIKNGDTIDIIVGWDNRVTFTVENILPATADLTVDAFDFEFDWGIYASFDADAKTITVSGSTGGANALTIKTLNTTMSITVNVTLLPPTSMTPVVIYPDYTEETTNTADMYAGVGLEFKTEVGENCDPAFKAEITDGPAGASIEAIPYSTNYKFNATTPGTYTIKITSTRDDSVSTTLTVTVLERPVLNIGEILNGKYNIDFYGTILYEFTFTPESEGATKGTLEVVDNNGGYNAGTYTYEYLADGIEILDSYGMPAFVSIDMDVEGNLTFNGSYGSYEMIRVVEGGGDDVEPEILNGTYNVNFLMDGLYVLTFNPQFDGADYGMVTVVDNNNGRNPITGDYSYGYNYDNGCISVINSDISLIFGEDGSIFFSCESLKTPQPLVKVEGGAGGEEEPELLNGTYNVNFLMDGLYVLTFEPDSVGADFGIVTVVDNLSGAISGTYRYGYNYDGGIDVMDMEYWDTDAFILSMDPGGNVTFQCQGLPTPQLLVKVEGGAGGEEEPELLNGTYNVNFLMDGLYVLTFEPDSVGADFGIVTVVDNLSGAISGTYRYGYNYDGGIDVMDMEYWDTDAFILSMDPGGNVTFQCQGLPNPQPLVPADGGNGEGGEVDADASGVYQYNDYSLIVELYADGTGKMLDGWYSFEASFDYTLTDNGDGTYGITFSNVEGTGAYSSVFDFNSTDSIYDGDLILADSFGSMIFEYAMAV